MEYVQPGSKQNDLNFYSLLGILQSGMWLKSDIDEYLAQFKISHGRFSILLSIMESPDKATIANELAIKLGKSKPTITKMIHKLAADGFIRIVDDIQDRRSKNIILTKKATSLLNKIIPEYNNRINSMASRLTDSDKNTLLNILSKIDFHDPVKKIIRNKKINNYRTFSIIKQLCKQGTAKDIDAVMTYLNNKTDLPTTKVIDFYLGLVEDKNGIKRIHHYLFNGTQIQRNYCTLYFARRNEWDPVNKAFELGLIDAKQAYSR